MRALREWMRRLLGAVRTSRSDHDMEEELRLHMELAAEDATCRADASPESARAARIHVGGAAQAMDALRDQRGLPWLDALRSDIVFGWRQLNKHRTASAAAILSLGLAVGATTAAFRLVDAMLLRTMPVADPDRLFVLSWEAFDSQGRSEHRDDLDYPTFRRYVERVGGRAALMILGASSRQQIRIGTSDEPELAYKQYVSGNVFPAFGLQPAAGRLLTVSDDITPGGHPVAVISYEFWTRRFGRDPRVVGQTFQWGRGRFEIVGVAPKGFIGTEPGRVTDMFIPSMMNAEAIDKLGWSWFRMWVRPSPGVSPEQVRQMLQSVFIQDHQARLKTFPADTPQPRIDAFLREELALTPAGSGSSNLQRRLRIPLLILAALVVLVLLIACANVANLLIAQAMTRAREMALRVSIGAGRRRLIQLVLIESALLAILASTVGALFAWWAAPFVVSLLSGFEEPVRLILDVDWRALGFGVALTMTVTVLFGLAPALRAAAVDPLGTLKGSDDRHAHRRLTSTLIAAQMAFCVFVVFVTGLFVSTFGRLSDQPLGFSQDRLLVLETETRGDVQPAGVWRQVPDHIRAMPGVESAALAGWAPLTGNRWTASVLVAGREPESRPPYFLDVSPGYFETMRIGLTSGRDFLPADAPPKIDDQSRPLLGVGIVNQAFARLYFNGQNPIGKRVTVRHWTNVDMPMEIVGLVGDAVYLNVRDPIPPTVYVPLDEKRNSALIIRTAGDPMLLATTMRREVSRARSDISVSNVSAQSALVQRQLILERLLATLSLFFAVIALLLAGVGLYGVLNHAVIQQRREIGVRMALGARAAHVIRRVSTNMLGMVGIGSVIGLVGGLAFGRLIEQLLFQVKATDPMSLALPLVALAAAATVAALPPAVRAVRTDPAQTLRSE